MQIIPLFFSLVYKRLRQRCVGEARVEGLFRSAAEQWEHAEHQHQQCHFLGAFIPWILNQVLGS